MQEMQQLPGQSFAAFLMCGARFRQHLSNSSCARSMAEEIPLCVPSCPDQPSLVHGDILEDL